MSGDNVHEIVIIKRVSGGHEDEHHGGVWKIAFADFMTAMMAFFLVMWLISANDKTKAVIARYFNPVQLVDSTPQPRGLEDPKPGAPSVMPRSGATAPHEPAKDTKSAGEAPPKPEQSAEAEASKAAKQDEEKLLRDPYAVLADIAAKDAAKEAKEAAPAHGASKAKTDGKLAGAASVGTKGGEAYRDPFEPVASADAADATGEQDRAAARAGSEEKPSDDAKPSATQSSETKIADAKASDVKPSDARSPDAKLSEAKSATVAKAGDVPEPLPHPTMLSEAAAKLKAEIQAMTKGDAAAAGRAPTVEVRQTDEGLLVDVTDGTDFAMFGSASARPTPKTVLVMEKIGRLLKSQPGSIVLRGFTDGRPFKSDLYDNWRLSTARADMAHYMLVRGGIDESRFERIEGYADRRPKDTGDLASPANRRIQILVRGPKL